MSLALGTHLAPNRSSPSSMPTTPRRVCYRLGGMSRKRCTISCLIRELWVRRSCSRSMRQRMLVSDQTIEPNMRPIIEPQMVTYLRPTTALPIRSVSWPPSPLHSTVPINFRLAAWYQEKLAGADPTAELVGRSWYSSLGHLNATWQVGLPSSSLFSVPPAFLCS